MRTVRSNVSDAGTTAVGVQRKSRRADQGPLGSRTFLPALVLAVWAACAAGCGWIDAAAAQVEPASDGSPSRPVQRIPVPFDRPAERPEGDWVPIRSGELKELLGRSKPAAGGPRRTWIERATYSATFDGSRLRGGVLTADVRHQSDRAELMDLEPLNLAVSELAWAHQPAIWGTTDDGRTALLVDGEQQRLYGRWNLVGRKLPRSVEFDVRVPSAVVSRLRLRLPEGFLLSTSAGEFTASADDGEAGWREWRVELGSQTRCRIAIRRRQDASPAQPLVLTESNLSYVVRQEGMQLQAEFQVEAVHASVNLLVFTLPAEVDVHSVTYGGVHSLSWRSVPDGPNQQLPVQIPDSLLGRSRPIRISGFAPAALGETRLLPQPRLTAGLSRSSDLPELSDELFTGPDVKTLGNAAFLSGQVHLKIEAPVKLQAVSAEGLRQTAAVSTAGTADAFSFRQYLPEGTMRVDVDYPKLERAAFVLTHVDTSGENWSMTAHVDWVARAGESFEADSRLAPGWEVTEVRPRSESSALTNWEVQTQRGGVRQLKIEFREAIAPGRPKSVEIVARRLPLRRRRSMALPLLRPVDHASVSQLIAVSRPGSTIARLDAESTFAEIEADALPPFAAGSDLLQAIASPAGGKPLLLFSTDPAARGALQLDQRGPSVDARVWSIHTVQTSRLTETFRARLFPAGTSVDRVYVYLTAQAGDVKWTLEASGSEDVGQSPESPPTSLKAVRVSPDRHSDWDLPTGGELWEIQFSQPRRGEIDLRGSRSRPVSASIMPTLAFIPGSTSFQGIVELRTSGEIVINVQADGLIPTRPDALIQQGLLEPGGRRRAPTGGWSGRLWQYDSPNAALLLRVREGAADSRYRRLATLLLESMISGEHPGFDRHRATFRLIGGSVPADFRFELSEPAVLLATSWNGRAVKSRRIGEKWVLSPPPAGGENSANEVMIEYRFPSSGGRPRRSDSGTSDSDLSVSGDSPKSPKSFRNPLGSDSRTIVVPKCDYTILEFDWRFATPPDVWLAEEPESFALHDRLPRLSWNERLFGPLGRTAGAGVFNPFVADSWLTLSQPRPGSAGRTSNRPAAVSDGRFAPPGWTVYRATSLQFRPTLTLSTWQYSRGRLLAWLGTLGCLLVGLLLRIRRTAIRSHVFGYWLSVCLFAAALSPAFYAVIAGGCLLGTVVALLFPRRLLEKLRFERPTVGGEGNAVPLGSTESFQRSPATALLIVALLTAAQSAAQEVPADNSRGDEQRPAVGQGGPNSSSSGDAVPIRILVPDDPSGVVGEGEPVAYVERRDLAYLRGLARRGRRPDLGPGGTSYLVSWAEYASRVDGQDAVTVTARYRMHLLPGAESARVAFPDARSNPGECVVNGRPHPIVLAEDGRQFYVELDRTRLQTNGTSSSPEVESFEVELIFHPATTAVAGGNGFRLNVLPVTSARLRQDFDAQPPTLELIGARGERDFLNDGRTLLALLGPAREFQVMWSKNAEPVGSPAQLGAKLTTHVQTRPTWLEFTYHVDYKLVDGRVDYLLWRLPHFMQRAVVRSASINGEPVDYSTASTADGRTRLLLEFGTSQEQDFAVDVLVVVPAPAGGNGSIIRVPATPNVDEPASDPLAQPYLVSVSESLLGIAAPLEFEISPAVRAPGVDSSGNEASGAKSISVESFLARAVGNSPSRPTQFAYQVSGPQELVFELKAAAPQRKVRMIQTGTVRPGSLDWAVSAVLETSRAPAFRHRLRIDPQLTITEISVREDDAERLAGWSRRGNSLELFLSDKTAGTQSVTLSGSRRFAASAPTRLPLVEFEDAEVIDSRLRLYYEPGLTARLAGAEELTQIEAPPPAAETTLEPLGQFRVPDDPGQPRLQVFGHDEHLHSETVTRLERRQEGGWRIVYGLRLTSDEGPINRVRLRVPAGAPTGGWSVGDFRFDPEVVREREETASDGSVLITIRPQAGPTDSWELRIALALGEPKSPTATWSGREWSLPAVFTPDVPGGKHSLIIAGAPEIRPADPDAREVSEENLPDWARSPASAGDRGGRQRVYASDSLPWVLVADVRGEEAASARIPLVDTQIWHGGSGGRFGRTTVLIASAAEGELELSWPENLRVRALFVDGRAVVPGPVEPKSRRLRIPTQSGTGAHVVAVHWSQENPVGKLPPAFGPSSQSLPQPRRADVERSLVTFLPRAGAFVTAGDGLTEFGPLEYRLQLAESLYELSRSHLRDGRGRPPLWELLLELQRQIKLELAASGRNAADAEGQRADWQDRFRQVSLGIAELRRVVEAEPADGGAGTPQWTFARDVFPWQAAGPEGTNLPSAPVITAPNRDVVAGRLTRENPQSGTTPVAGFWEIDRLLVTCALLLIGLPLIPVVRRLVRLPIGRWLDRHQPIAWTLLGILWWACLSPSAVGGLLLLIAGLVAVWERRRAKTAPASAPGLPLAHSSRSASAIES